MLNNSIRRRARVIAKRPMGATREGFQRKSMARTALYMQRRTEPPRPSEIIAPRPFVASGFPEPSNLYKRCSYVGSAFVP